MSFNLHFQWQPLLAVILDGHEVPISTVLVNLYMEHTEAYHFKIIFPNIVTWVHYVDDSPHAIDEKLISNELSGFPIHVIW